jgi:hypothetical protein
VASSPSGDLLICAKDLFVEATAVIFRCGVKGFPPRPVRQGRPAGERVASVRASFGYGHAAANPDLVIAVLNAASSDYAAQLIAHSLQDIAAALAVEDEPLPQNAPAIVRAQGLVRAGP